MEAVASKYWPASVGICSMVYVRIWFMVAGICKLIRMSASGHARRHGVDEFWSSVSWGGNEVECMRVCEGSRATTEMVGLR